MTSYKATRVDDDRGYTYDAGGSVDTGRHPAEDQREHAQRTEPANRSERHVTSAAKPDNVIIIISSVAFSKMFAQSIHKMQLRAKPWTQNIKTTTYIVQMYEVEFYV